MRKQNTKITIPLHVVPDRRTVVTEEGWFGQPKYSTPTKRSIYVVGKEIENDKKWDEKKLRPRMNVYSLISTLTLPWICFIQNNDFEKDQILKKKKLEKWPIG